MWSYYWQAPWTLFGPMAMMLVLLLMYMAGSLFMIRIGTIHRASAGSGPAATEVSLRPLTQYGNSRQPDRRHAFEEYRNETLRRVDQEEREFHELMDHLRKAQEKAEFGSVHC